MRQTRVALLQFLLSLVLALALWTFVSFTQNPVQIRSFEVPITTTPLPENLISVDLQSGIPRPITGTVQVRASGPREEIVLARQDQFEALVSLDGLSEGTRQVPINVTPPDGVQIVSQQPRAITVRLEPQATQEFSIRENVIGQPPYAELEAGAIRLATDEVLASGPSALIDQIAQVQVRIDLQGRLATYTETLPLEAVSESGELVDGIQLTPDHVNVTVNIQPRIRPQRVSVLPEITGDVPSGYIVERFDWTPKSVEVIAPIVITTTLKTEPIDLTGRTESFTQTVRLIDVDNAITQLENDMITVSVEIVPFGVVSNLQLYIPTITPENLGPDARVETLPPGFTVTVSGTYQQLSQLAGTVIRATVDMGGRGPGTYTLPVTIDLPPGVEIIGDPPQATITAVPLIQSTPTQNAPSPQ